MRDSVKKIHGEISGKSDVEIDAKKILESINLLTESINNMQGQLKQLVDNNKRRNKFFAVGKNPENIERDSVQQMQSW